MNLLATVETLYVAHGGRPRVPAPRTASARWSTRCNAPGSPSAPGRAMRWWSLHCCTTSVDWSVPLPATRGDDDRDLRTVAWLAPHLGVEVIEPIRLHVTAKRYLAATDPRYVAKLDPQALRQLERQGGRLSSYEVWMRRAAVCRAGSRATPVGRSSRIDRASGRRVSATTCRCSNPCATVRSSTSWNRRPGGSRREAKQRTAAFVGNICRYRAKAQALRPTLSSAAGRRLLASVLLFHAGLSMPGEGRSGDCHTDPSGHGAQRWIGSMQWWSAPARSGSRWAAPSPCAASRRSCSRPTSGIGNGISSRNSEVIHAGLYDAPGSLKARLCVAGREALYAYCESHGVGAPTLRQAGRRSDAGAGRGAAARSSGARVGNGVDRAAMAERRRGARSSSRRCAGEAALLSTVTGIIDSHALMLAYLGDLEHAGGALVAALAAVESAVVAGAASCCEVGGAAPIELADARTSSTPPGCTRRRWRVASTASIRRTMPRRALRQGQLLRARRPLAVHAPRSIRCPSRAASACT